MEEGQSEIEMLYDVAVLGEQVDAFFKSDIGKFLDKRINEEIEEGLTELRTVDCTSQQAVFMAQGKVLRAERIRSWLEEALLAGLKARMILEDRED